MQNEIITISSTIDYLSSTQADLIETISRLEMYNKSIEPFTKLNGVYFTDKYYCVWTQDRPEEEIASTKTEEQCHALVYLDYPHFCEDKAAAWMRNP